MTLREARVRATLFAALVGVFALLFGCATRIPPGPVILVNPANGHKVECERAKGPSYPLFGTDVDRASANLAASREQDRFEQCLERYERRGYLRADTDPQVLNMLPRTTKTESAQAQLSVDSQRVLDFLKGRPAAGQVVSGHSMFVNRPIITGTTPEGSVAEPVAAVRNFTGRYPGILEAEYQDVVPWGVPRGWTPPGIPWTELNPHLLAHWRQRGGLISIVWHPRSPADGEVGETGWSGTDPACTPPMIWPGLCCPRPNSPPIIANINDVITPGGRYYNTFSAMVDEVGRGLRDLRQQEPHIVVLFRPFHAPDNDNWGPFWWTRDPVRFKALWNFIYNRLTDPVTGWGFDNLIWVEDFNHGAPARTNGYPCGGNVYSASDYLVPSNQVHIVTAAPQNHGRIQTFAPTLPYGVAEVFPPNCNWDTRDALRDAMATGAVYFNFFQRDKYDDDPAWGMLGTRPNPDGTPCNNLNSDLLLGDSRVLNADQANPLWRR